MITMNKSNAMSFVLKNNAQLLKKRRHEKAWSIVPKSKMKTTAYDFPAVGKKQIVNIGKRIKKEQITDELMAYTITLALSCILIYSLIDFLW